MKPSEKARSKGNYLMIVRDIEEGQGPEETEPEPPSWMLLSDTARLSNELFRNLLFLEGYDLSSNIYVVVGEYLSVIDPGNDYTAFIQLFERPDFAPGDIRKIVLTHGHPDHAMGTLELFRYPSIRNNPELEVILCENGPEQLKRIIRDFRVRIREVHNGDILDTNGIDWEIIHTPGHTRDGICLYHAPTATLLSGDMVLPQGMAAPDKQAGGRLDHYLASLKSLLLRDIRHLLPGHGPPIVANGRKIVEESCLAVCNRIFGVASEQPPSWFQTASAAARSEMPREAVFCCGMAIEANPSDLNALKLQAFCLNDLGEFEKALDTLLLLEKNFPSEKDDPYAMMGKGYALLGLEKYDESLRFFDTVLEMAPDQKDARTYKALALFLWGKVEAAMEIEEFRDGFMERGRAEMLKALGNLKKESR